MKQFQIHRQDADRTQVVETPTPEPAPGEAVLRVQHFGFTANNITYAVLGDAMDYWRFFPAVGSPAEEWGVVPVWGYAEVMAERDSPLKIGERLFGYLPSATHVVVRPQGEPGRSVVDVAEHRADLPATYNSYQRVAASSGEAEGLLAEDLRMLLFPLYLTSWALGDMLDEEDSFGAEQVLVASASSKTALGLAYAMRAEGGSDRRRPTLVGLTSTTNRAWVESLGLYDRVVVYDDVGTAIEVCPTVIVDMAGNGPLLGRLHTRLGDAMLRTVSVGITHWEDFGAHDDVIGERTEFFFAPSVIAKRVQEWGGAEFTRRTEAFLSAASTASAEWMRVEPSTGLEALTQVYAGSRAGSVDPAAGPVIRL